MGHRMISSAGEEGLGRRLECWAMAGASAAASCFGRKEYSGVGQLTVRMIIAKKRPKTKFVRARVFILGLFILTYIVLYLFLSRAFYYPVSAEILLTDGIVAAALFVVVLLPIVWKRLGEDLAGYRLLTRNLMKGRRGLLYSLASAIVPTVTVILILLWLSGGRNVSDVLSEFALPLTLAFVLYGLASFWFVDQRALRAARPP